MIENKDRQLRVVWNSDVASHDVRSVSEPTQLSLEFSQNEDLITCLGDSELTAGRLVNLLHRLRPSVVLDLRACPRFDMLGYSRKRAFADFERLQTKYFCLTTEEAAKPVAERVDRLVAKMSFETQCLVGPFIALVETAEVIEQIRRDMPAPKTPSGKWTICVEGVFSQSSSRPARLHAI